MFSTRLSVERSLRCYAIGGWGVLNVNYEAPK